MNFCPRCGSSLIDAIIDNDRVKQCNNCTYIDWNNWIYISAVVVAYNHSNEFLMVKLKGKEQGKITFPGGFRNLGETLEEAAIREFYEETGIKIKNVELYKAYTKDEQRLVWIVYKAKIEQIVFRENDEVSEILFVSKQKPIDTKYLRGTLSEKLYFEILKDLC
jgi:NADH pyrophosphatase NudC (nudix superfamily)